MNAHGGGLTGQADAVRLGVARALCQLDPDNRKPLKTEGYLTRDPRAKERKNMVCGKLEKHLSSQSVSHFGARSVGECCLIIQTKLLEFT